MEREEALEELRLFLPRNRAIIVAIARIGSSDQDWMTTYTYYALHPTGEPPGAGLYCISSQLEAVLGWESVVDGPARDPDTVTAALGKLLHGDENALLPPQILG